MARIRSVHPGLFTDEAFVSLSEAAQVLLIGLWTEADDQGVFEWKTVTIKMRLRPTKDGPIEPLLLEMVNLNCIKIYEMSGRKYGAIRNFRRFQRPKSPNSIHIITNEIRIYVGLAKQVSENDFNEVTPFPQNGEMSPQMEEGGGRMEEERWKKDPSQGKIVPLRLGGGKADDGRGAA